MHFQRCCEIDPRANLRGSLLLKYFIFFSKHHLSRQDALLLRVVHFLARQLWEHDTIWLYKKMTPRLFIRRWKCVFFSDSVFSVLIKWMNICFLTKVYHNIKNTRHRKDSRYVGKIRSSFNKPQTLFLILA